MTSENPMNPLTPQERAALFDAAKLRAAELRREAIDDFWRDADAVLQRCLQDGTAAAARSARRLQARLARHWRHRGASVLEG